eukprot:481078-Pleurochrysis_carterae.AAC.4
MQDTIADLVLCTLSNILQPWPTDTGPSIANLSARTQAYFRCAGIAVCRPRMQILLCYET